MRVGLSGHQRLRDPAGWEWVRREVRDCLAPRALGLVGITSLAVGADTLFAELVLEFGGALEVVVPFAGYEEKFDRGYERERYLTLLGRAASVEVLPPAGTEEEAYLAAGKRVVGISSLVLLVWDGEAAAGRGGTGDIAAYARQERKTFIHINPETRTVTR